MVKKNYVIIAILVAMLIIFAGSFFKPETSKAVQCSDTQEPKLQCWEKFLDHILEAQGLDQAFEELALLYESEPMFASNCHDFAHILGMAAYRKFIKEEDFNLNNKASYCGYGFYHGFMEGFITKGDFEKAADFCQHVYSNSTIVLGNACYHGLGHGVAAIWSAQYYGDLNRIVDSSLETCRKLGHEFNPFSKCNSGVFMELANHLVQEKDGLKIDTEDPLKICRYYEKDVAENCYGQMSSVIGKITGGDLAKAVKYFEEISDDKVAGEAWKNTIGALANRQIMKSNVDVCHNIQKRLRLSCIKGLAQGLITGGLPGEEYKEGIDFCLLSDLNQEEKSACLDFASDYLSSLYSTQELNSICELSEDKYKNIICKNEIL